MADLRMGPEASAVGGGALLPDPSTLRPLHNPTDRYILVRRLALLPGPSGLARLHDPTDRDVLAPFWSPSGGGKELWLIREGS